MDSTSSASKTKGVRRFLISPEILVSIASKPNNPFTLEVTKNALPEDTRIAGKGALLVDYDTGLIEIMVESSEWSPEHGPVQEVAAPEITIHYYHEEKSPDEE